MIEKNLFLDSGKRDSQYPKNNIPNLKFLYNNHKITDNMR